MKGCELCNAPAEIYCESDQASLCWKCDSRVHGANFLVARHSRNLLCRSCHSLTSWKASGSTLDRTVSVCESCDIEAKGREDGAQESEGCDENEIDAEDEDLEIFDDDDSDDDADNQVVPWSSTAPPPPSWSSEESVGRFTDGEGDISKPATVFSLKRIRENASDLRSQDLSSPSPTDYLQRSSSDRSRIYGSSSAETIGDGEATSGDSLRPLKQRRTEADRPVDLHFCSALDPSSGIIGKKSGN